MAVKKNSKSGLWVASACARHPTSKKPRSLRRKNIKSEAEARRVERSLHAKILSAFEAQLSGPKLYGDLLVAYERSLNERDLRNQTIANTMTSLRKHTGHWNDRSVNSIGSDEIRKLIKVTVANRKQSHQKNILKYVKGIFEYAFELGAVNRNPTPIIKFRATDKIKGVLSATQAKTLLEKALELDHDWYPVWLTALYTGMRNGELLALTWDKIDFESNSILVSSSQTRRDGKADLTKSGQDRRVDMAFPVRSLFQKLKLESDDCENVLPRLHDWNAGRQSEVLRTFLAGSGLPRIRFHDLRATWATMLLTQGIEPVKVMKLGGWKDLKTLMVYTRKAGIDTMGTLRDFSIHEDRKKQADVISISQKNGGL